MRVTALIVGNSGAVAGHFGALLLLNFAIFKRHMDMRELLR